MVKEGSFISFVINIQSDCIFFKIIITKGFVKDMKNIQQILAVT